MENGSKEKGAVSVQERPRRTLGFPEEFQQYFDRRFRDWPFRFLKRPTGWLPDMDVFEAEGAFVVRTDLPGLKAEDIDVSVEKDVLTIQGHREEAKEVKEEDYHCSERATGRFFRSIRLPGVVAADGVEAKYADGVLDVRVPKPAAEGKPTKIDVKK